MSEKYYYIEPYQKKIEATITGITQKGIILDRTISYPEGGGQPGDRGFINDVKYTDTIHDNGEIVHVINNPSSFNIGDKVSLTIDWEHRYDYMQQHSAQHLLSGILYNKYNIGTVSVHQGEDILTIETDSSFISDETLLNVEADAIKAICENHRIYYKEMSHSEAEALGLRRTIKVEGDVRLVFIEDVDVIACGGLHVASTGEIMELSYAGSEMIRGHVRTIWRTGNRAIAKRRRDSESVKKISALLSSPEEKVVLASQKIVDEVKALRIRIRLLEERAAGEELERSENSIFSTSYSLASFIPNLKSGEFFITHVDEERLQWLYYGSEDRFNLIKSKFKELGLKGGGRAPLYQGVCVIPENELLGAVKEILN